MLWLLLTTPERRARTIDASVFRLVSLGIDDRDLFGSQSQPKDPKFHQITLDAYGSLLYDLLYLFVPRLRSLSLHRKANKILYLILPLDRICGTRDQRVKLVALIHHVDPGTNLRGTGRLIRSRILEMNIPRDTCLKLILVFNTNSPSV